MEFGVPDELGIVVPSDGSSRIQLTSLPTNPRPNNPGEIPKLDYVVVPREGNQVKLSDESKI